MTARAELAFDRGGTGGVQFDPPCPVAFDNAIRVVLAADTFPKGKRSVTLTLNFPEDVEYWERVANEQVKRGRKADAVQSLLEGREQLTKKTQRSLAMSLSGIPNAMSFAASGFPITSVFPMPLGAGGSP